MKLTQLLVDQFDREVVRSRAAVANVPQGHEDWAPHPKSMPLLRLAGLVASMPSWFALIVNQDELDLNPPAGAGRYQQPEAASLAAVVDKTAIDGRAALAARTDEFLLTTSWKLLSGGKLMAEYPRHVVIADTFSHWAHHRGQLTVYLRLLGAKVPAIYGPSADDQRFA